MAAPKKMPSVAYLRSALHYDSETGILSWRRRSARAENWNSRWAGRAAGSVNGKGYLHINLDGRFYPAHRVAFAIHTGRHPAGEIDHINGNRADNRACNLREATLSENRRNMRARGEFAKGVYRNQRGKFVAQIKLDGATKYLGSFDSETAAHKAYAREAKKNFGEFACWSR